MREIIGVVGDAQQAAFGAERDPIYYFPFQQLPWGVGTIVLRTAVPPLEIEPAARDALADLDRLVPMHQVRTGEQLSAGVRARIFVFTGQVWATRSGLARRVFKALDRVIIACTTHALAGLDRIDMHFHFVEAIFE